MKILNLAWKWSWFVTLPLTCVFLYWGYGTVARYSSFAVFYDTRPIPVSLLTIGQKEFYSLYRTMSLAMTQSWQRKAPIPGDLEVINLFVPEGRLAELNANLPHSGFEYVKGAILNNNKIEKMKFRYRGDFVYHWGNRKKSLRVKTSKKKMFNGVRTFNLIAPKQLQTHFGCLLAQNMGLIAPETDLVEVTLNGKLLGVHAYVEQLEELTLREHKCMPGDLYAGEMMAKDRYRGISWHVFDYPMLWKKLAVNNHYPEESRKPLQKLLSLPQASNSVQAHAELLNLIDVETWGKFAAYETLTQSFHYDNAHNWRLYYDPMKSRFFPVIWDPVAWHPIWVPKKGQVAQLDIMPSLLHNFLFENGDVLRAKSLALDEFYKSGQDIEFLNQINAILPGLERAISRDPLISKSPVKIIRQVHAFRDSVRQVFADVKHSYFDHRKPLKYALEKSQSSDFRMALSVSSRAPTKPMTLSFINKFDKPITGFVRYWVNGKIHERDISGALSQNGATLEVAKSLVASHLRITVGQISYKKTRLQVEPGYYEIILKGIDPLNEFVDLMIASPDGVMTVGERVTSLSETSFSDLYNIINEQPIVLPEVWQGVIEISDVVTIDRPLIIKPGSVIRFSPGASLILNGRLLAEGTKAWPIRFISAQEEQEPWGTVVLQGAGANSSRLKHCQFIGGSGLKGDLFEYTAMFSVHDVQGVTVDHCSFVDSRITDDMVHVVYSKVRFSDCRFEGSLMDALDIDISDAVIARCDFIDSGNDAIDLMTSTAVVFDTFVENSGDKAASVGEGSTLLAINNIFYHNGIGVQAKDGSVATLFNMDFKDNDHAIDAYKKNWRYNNGGKIYMYKSSVTGSEKMLTADKKSRIRVYDSYLDVFEKPKKKRIKFAASVDSIRGTKAQESHLVRNKRELEFMIDFNSDYFMLIDPKRRGALFDVRY